MEEGGEGRREGRGGGRGGEEGGEERREKMEREREGRREKNKGGRRGGGREEEEDIHPSYKTYLICLEQQSVQFKTLCKGCTSCFPLASTVVVVVFAAEVTFWWYFLTRLPRRPLGLKWAPFRTDTASHTRAPAPLTLRRRGKEGGGS